MDIDKEKSRSSSARLRREAEAQVRTRADSERLPRPDVETQRLFHELQVHQIELEMQNEELRQARHEVERALEKYAELYDFAPVGYFTLDRDGAVGAANVAGASLLGVERARLPGKSFELFVVDEDRLRFTEFLGEVFASQGKDSCEIRLITAQDSPFFVRIEAVAIGARQECLVAVIDITEHKHAEDLLRIHMEELEAINQDLNRFNTASVARELRMIELKKEVNELYEQSGRRPRYHLDFEK